MNKCESFYVGISFLFTICATLCFFFSSHLIRFKAKVKDYNLSKNAKKNTSLKQKDGEEIHHNACINFLLFAEYGNVPREDIIYYHKFAKEY